jgi:hypothetical protein
VQPGVRDGDGGVRRQELDDLELLGPERRAVLLLGEVEAPITRRRP